MLIEIGFLIAIYQLISANLALQKLKQTPEKQDRHGNYHYQQFEQRTSLHGISVNHGSNHKIAKLGFFLSIINLLLIALGSYQLNEQFAKLNQLSFYALSSIQLFICLPLGYYLFQEFLHIQQKAFTKIKITKIIKHEINCCYLSTGLYLINLIALIFFKFLIK